MNKDVRAMNSDVKERWIEALRSGLYRQGMHSLMQYSDIDGVSFCCLGVLCATEGYGHRPSSGLPGHRNLRKASLTKSAAITLAEMNDSGDFSFKKIANWIERYL